MDLVPPVMPGQKSTYTPVRKTGTTSDFDDCSVKAAAMRAHVLCLLKKRFGQFVVTVGELFEIRELLEDSAAGDLVSTEHYKVQQFGHALRGKLIKKWFSLGSDGIGDRSEFLAKCDQAERTMNLVMTRSIIPSVPLYLLTLLQSVEAGRSGDFRESALGYYYQYLLTESLQKAGVKPDKLTELFQYCAQLAWHFHLQRANELSESDLRRFNEAFCRTWHTVDFRARLAVLVEARVLGKQDEQYSFRYPYIYYYLKGQYLSENLVDLETRAYITRCCHHLYVREHANTVLFLAHHTNDDFVLNTIAESLHSLFPGRSPITFDGDTDGIRGLIEHAPKLAYSGGSPERLREMNNEARDELRQDGDGLLDAEEVSTPLSLPAQMSMLFKTVEILGQVLKNQYSKISRVRKGELLRELFEGPLRALADFVLYCEKYPALIVSEVEAALKRRKGSSDEKRREQIARKVVASVIELVAFSFVMKTAEAVSSESLAEDVEAVVRKSDSLAFRMIEMIVVLDSPRALPKRKLLSLHKESARDVVAARLVQLIVLHRLYMFRVSEKDMLWLSSELDIDIKSQHKITYQSPKARRLQ